MKSVGQMLWADVFQSFIMVGGMMAIVIQVQNYVYIIKEIL